MKKLKLATPQFSTILIQEIVSLLKLPPFNETLTLMSFDEKREYELLDLILNVLGMIDAELSPNRSDHAEIMKTLTEFLKLVNFPYSGDKQLEEDLARGDKKILIQILHFLLTKINDLKKRYYLSKYLNNIMISDEFTGDEEILDTLNKYRELQSDFQAVYQMAEEKRASTPQVKELKDDIKKFQSDKLQLTASIANFKKNYSHLKDFQELFEITSKLRKEQEEDSNLDKRLAKQNYDIEDIEDRLVVGKQRLLECKKNLNDNVSAFELLESLRNQRNANREAYDNLTKYELQDKKTKLKSLEEILVLPDISFEEISKLKKDQLNLHNQIEKLENKLKNSAHKSSELTIYKQNALQAANNKESSLKILEKLEKEKNLSDIKYQELEKKFENSKGYKFVRKDDILQQAENVKKKKEIFINYNKTLDGIKGESLILERTINLVKYKTEEGESIVKGIEEKNGISSLNIQRKELEELSRKKQEIDVSKALTLEEYSKLIQQIRQKIQETQEKHAPVIEEHAKIKAEYEKIQPTFTKKKQVYENAISDEQGAYNKVKEQFDKLEVEFKNCQNKYHQMNVSSKITEELIKRYEVESGFLSKPDKKLNASFKSYTEYYKAITSQQEELVKDLKERQKSIKGTYEDNLRQIKFFNDLKKILEVKKQSILSAKK